MEADEFLEGSGSKSYVPSLTHLIKKLSLNALEEEMKTQEDLIELNKKEPEGVTNVFVIGFPCDLGTPI